MLIIEGLEHKLYFALLFACWPWYARPFLIIKELKNYELA